MLKRIGNLTVATNRLNIGMYYNHTPYRTTLFGFNPFGRWLFGRSHTLGVRAFSLGPIVFGRYNLSDVGKAAR